MTPPQQIGNPILGRAHGSSVADTPSPAPNAQRTRQLSRGMEQAAETNQGFVLQGISQEYGVSLSERISRDPQELQGLLSQYRSGIRRAQATGDLNQRSQFYFALRTLYLLLPHGNEVQLNNRLLEFTEISEAYQRFLEQSSLPTDQRFRYLYAVSQITHSALAQVQGFRHDPARANTANRFIPLLQNLLGQMDQQDLSYYDNMIETDNPYAPYLRGLVGEVRLRQALLSGHRENAQALARDLVGYYQTTQVIPESEDAFINSIRNWEIRYRDLIARPAQLGSFIQVTPELRTHFYSTAFRFEIFAQIGASLDQYNETDEATIQQRYQAISAVFSSLSLSAPNLNFSQIWDQIRNPDFTGNIQNILQRQRQNNPSLRESIDGALQAIGTEDLSRLVHLAQATARGWQAYRNNAGRRLMEVLFQDDLSQEELGRQVLESYQVIANNPEEHELGALGNVAQLMINSESLPGDAQIPAALIQQARNLLDEMNSFSFRAGRIASHLFSGSGLATLIGGTLFAELAPAFLIGRAGRAGSYANMGRRLGYLVEAGTLTRVGAVANGVGTGLVLSLVGSALHNIERSGLGFETHFWRDFGTSSVINVATFGAAMGTSHVLSSRLAPNLAQGHRLGRINWGRTAAIRGGSILVGGTTALALGTLPRGIQSGRWMPSADEIAESYMTMMAFELLGGALRTVRHQASLRTELGAYRFGSEGSALRSAERGFSTLITNRYIPVLGSMRSNAILNHVDLMMMEGTPPHMQVRDNAFPNEGRFLRERIGLEEMHHPGVLPRMIETRDAGGILQALGQGSSRNLLFSTETHPTLLWDYSIPRLGRRQTTQTPSPNRDSAPPGENPNAEDTQPHPAIFPPPLELPGAEEIAAGGDAPFHASTSGRRHVEQMPAVQPGELTGPLQIPDIHLESRIPTTPAPPRTPPIESTPASRARMSTPVPGQEMFPGHAPRIVDELFAETGRPRLALDSLILENLGEVAALTEVGNQGGPEGRTINEDAFAIYYDPQGRATLMVADGMGGDGGGGEIASRIAVQRVIETLATNPEANLLDAFQAAHTHIRQDPTSGRTAASAVRIHPNGRVELANIGDTQIFVARPQVNGGYAVRRVTMPDNFQGRVRDMWLSQGKPDQYTTQQMHETHSILSALGRSHFEQLSPVTRVSETPRSDEAHESSPSRALRDPNIVVHRVDMTLPSERNMVYRLQPGDLLILATDGVDGQFTTRQLAGSLVGSNAAEILNGLRGETHYRQTLRFRAAGLPNSNGLIHLGSLDLIGFDAQGRILFGNRETGHRLELNYLENYFEQPQTIIQPFRALEGRFLDNQGRIIELADSPEGQGNPIQIEVGRLSGSGLLDQLFNRTRLTIEGGSLQGQFIDADGSIFDQAEGGNHTATVSQDNMGLIVYRHLPDISN